MDAPGSRILLRPGGLGAAAGSAAAFPGMAALAQRVGAIRERAARAVARDREQNQRSGYRLPILILHLDDGLTSGSLPDIVDRAFPFHHQQHQPRTGGLKLCGNPERSRHCH